ncbi:hypothetical protein GPECTOR_35g899 [Gonium pectorale]|uniref:non-specific serine/threonine protein kinase n=1 Tax=Gonium pectorale TaxID=33097 RepID=A0A150GC80_GONPE|nr:hypothetical protein GPECTOR_35g899 [Gonium pectorale]|eukprot:KXZ47461.1 hypothetical protein GPECTOR_35g899 [Gonium pectorale]
MSRPASQGQPVVGVPTPPLVRQQSSRNGSRPASQGQPVARVEGEALSVVPACPGRLTEAYDVQKAVGKGGYAVVYKGIRREDGRVVAVKKVEIFEMSAKKRDRCLQEVTLLQQLDHPNIIQMLDAFIDENMLIIVFEWAPAGDLKRLIKKTAEQGKTLDESSIWSLFYQVTDGLRYMHQHRIMHRDIKPANVLVGANGALKLGDLGLGRQLSEQTMEAFSKVGTPYYVSPEVVRGAGYDWKSDVWSMGCLLYELACLRSPFEMEGANLYDVFQKISKGEYSPLPADQFSAPLRSLVGRMLQIDPAKRPELEEVWNITNSAVQSQSRTRSDVHGAAAEVYEQLVLLSSEVSERNRGKPPPPRTPPNGKRSASTPASASAAAATSGGPLAPPPLSTIRSLHPLYFSDSLVPTVRSDADAFQKQQLGAFMHDALGIAVQRVPLGVRLIQRPPEPPAEEVAEEAGAELEGAAESVLSTGAAARDRDTDDDDEAEYLGAGTDGDRARDSLVPGIASTSGGAGSGAGGSRGRGGGGAMSAAVTSTQVDPIAWRQEVERLAPQLRRIKIPAEMAAGDWSQRWQQTKEQVATLAQAAPDATASLGKIGSSVTQELDRIDTSERRLNANATELLEQYTAARRRLEAIQRDRRQLDELLEIGHAALTQLSENTEEAQQAIQDLTDGLDGSRQIKLMHDAMRSMRKEMRRMDLRIGAARHALWARQMQRTLKISAGVLGDGDGMGDDD